MADITYTITFTPAQGSLGTLIEYREDGDTTWVTPDTSPNPTTLDSYDVTLDDSLAYTIRVSSLGATCTSSYVYVFINPATLVEWATAKPAYNNAEDGTTDSNTLTVKAIIPVAPPLEGYDLFYRPYGTSDTYREGGNFTVEEMVIVDTDDSLPTGYEGYIRANYGEGIYGPNIVFHTNYNLALGNCIQELMWSCENEVTDIEINGVAIGAPTGFFPITQSETGYAFQIFFSGPRNATIDLSIIMANLGNFGHSNIISAESIYNLGGGCNTTGIDVTQYDYTDIAVGNSTYLEVSESGC